MIEQTLDHQRGVYRVHDTVDMILLPLFGIVGGARSIRCQNKGRVATRIYINTQKLGPSTEL